ncbi:hypothetical protein BLNAU_7275 [Blattamonas nauphoetae]|uniref:Uncharacterized protein n=1 Tax=Blattamonas nauphoetae TaxID=2049346 RepID=A0ABQ9Y272_9EUKA|nr:hypothetical protein BLNAU_7275 [Blattamonas nauphoetae]
MSVNTLHKPFMNFDVNSNLSFKCKSQIYCSLVALVKAEYPFDNVLQDKAVLFLKSLEVKRGGRNHTSQLVTDLVPSSAGSASGFAASIVTLLTSPHSRVVAAALSFLFNIAISSSTEIRCRLVASDLISTVLATVQPETLPIAGNEEMINKLVKIIERLADLAYPFNLNVLGIIASGDKFNHHEMIFQNVVLPSSQFVTFLISNQHVLNGDVFKSFMSLLAIFIRICPFHRPTLEFVLASPIVMTFSSCLSIAEHFESLHLTLFNITHTLLEWKRYEAGVAETWKRTMRALFSESFEDTLEQMTMRDKDGRFGNEIVKECHAISKSLGFNARRQ